MDTKSKLVIRKIMQYYLTGAQLGSETSCICVLVRHHIPLTLQRQVKIKRHAGASSHNNMIHYF